MCIRDRPVTYKEGRAEHMNAIEAKCGDIFFHSAADKALDITDLTYKLSLIHI